MDFWIYFQGLWFGSNTALWMLPCMTDDLVGSLSRRGISNVQQLLDLPRSNLQALIGNSNALRLYQVWSNVLKIYFFF